MTFTPNYFFSLKPLLVVAEDQIVHEGNPTVQIDEPIYMASQSSNTGEQQVNIPGGE